MSAAAERLAWARELRRQGAFGEGGWGLSPRGPFASLILHGLVALLIILGLPSLIQPPPEPPAVVPVDLVILGDKSLSPAHRQLAAISQQMAPETSPLRPPNPVPLPATPPPVPAAAVPNPGSGPIDPLAGMSLQGTPEPPKVMPKLKPARPAAVKPAKKPVPPVEDLAATLQSLSQQQQLQAKTPPAPDQQAGLGQSNVTAGSGDVGPMAMYSAKDFIRVQIERRWYLDRAAIGAGEFTVSLHLMLTADGHVSLAEIVYSMGYGENAAYLAAARSLRGAALLSSPLALPPGHYGEVKDVVLTFSPKDVLR
jgi:outer membrane biosynthesis protein TonB